MPRPLTRSRARCARALALATAAAAAATALPPQNVALNVTVDCATTVAPLPHGTWASCGYSPAEVAFRPDGVEHTMRIGATSNRGIAQVRIHFLLDLLMVTGFWPNASSPSGYSLTYDWAQLDFLVDTLVASRLSPGFELMGSPAGFPTLPASFWSVWDNNFKVPPNQTHAMFRQLVADTVAHYADRHGLAEVSQWNWESWNEPESGWGWGPLSPPVNASMFVAYALHFDAAAAGVADAEARTGGAFKFGGPGASQSPDRSYVLQWLLAHVTNGTNAWTGAPARLDFLSIHYKGRNTSYLVAQQALDGFTWMRQHGFTDPRVRAPAAGVAVCMCWWEHACWGWSTGAGIAAAAVCSLAVRPLSFSLFSLNPLAPPSPFSPPQVMALPFYNDEADPLVGWLNPQEWRADARYAAILPKIINQHLLQVADNGTVALNNPLGLLSFDNGFMNLDGYNGFGMRTLTARFTDPATGRYALVRKPGLAAMALLSRLGDTRVAVAGAAGPAEVAASTTGVIATVAAPSAAQPFGQVAALVYHSNDTVGGPESATVALAFANPPFAPGEPLMAVHWRIDGNHSSTAYAAWLAQGAPQVPSPAQLVALWAVDGLVPLGPPVPLTAPPAGGGPLLLVPPFELPMPGLSLVHVVARPPGGAPPPPPANPRAYVKDASLSLLTPAGLAEVLVAWDCDAPRGSAAAPPSVATFGYDVQVSTAGPDGPWATAQSAAAGDFSCSFLHAAPGGTPAQQRWYRVAAVDYWGAASAFSAVAQAAPWPAIA
jgi:hypothetical protein